MMEIPVIAFIACMALVFYAGVSFGGRMAFKETKKMVDDMVRRGQI